ncbi:hypothetical protein AMEX_G17163 [Astyanax mexicanus]|uniref:Uncharacterized protein n=1 Tax=Astyanax mexicanus TaxID=7994 RepID=A0A8T2LFX7_ASTMX|nr:hypothetical protein AMEX_G17163 [Astyanax mexicanus]
MPSKQPRRRGHAAAGVPDIRSDQRDPVTVDRLAFKYMEMCKVDSTSDSESDTSPRWSDASSKSFQGGTGLKRPTLPQKPFGRHYQQTLDPYDGSSEDSASSADGAKRQKRGGFRVKGRSCSRMAANPLPSHEVRRPGLRDSVPVIQFGDIHMRSSSDSELKIHFVQGHHFSSQTDYSAAPLTLEHFQKGRCFAHLMMAVNTCTGRNSAPCRWRPSLFSHRNKAVCFIQDPSLELHLSDNSCRIFFRTE